MADLTENTLLPFWKRLWHAGCVEGQNYRTQMRLQTMNFIYLNVALMTFTFVVWAFTNDDITNVVLSLVSFGLSLGVVLLNHLHLYRPATILHLLLSGLPALIFSVLLGFYNGFYLYVLVAPISMMTFIDMDNKVELTTTSIYYGLLFLVAFVLHRQGYTDLSNIHQNDYILFTNFVFNAIFIFILAYNFYQTNKLYREEIEAKNKTLEQQRDEIAVANEVLIEKNAEISDLVEVLNDKVKNNLQIMSLFTDLDSLNPPTTRINSLFRLHKSRIRVLNLSYKIIFEDKTPQSDWFSVFLENYYTFLRNAYSKRINPNSNIDVLTENAISVPRKRFETLMILLNEWHFRALESLPIDSQIDIVVMINKMETEIESKHTHIFALKIGGHTSQEPIIDASLKRLAHLRQIDMTSTYNQDTNIHQLELLF